MVIIWNFILIYLMSYILTEIKINEKRKLDSVQIIDIKVNCGTKIKIINSEYIPNRIYLNGNISKIKQTGLMDILTPGINNITLEWDGKKEKYSKLFKNANTIIEINFRKFDITGITLINSMFINCMSLKKITFNNDFNTSSVTDMSSMFKIAFH